MGRIIFIIGGARSGKSAYAVKLAGSSKGNVAFVATAEALDNEMKKRIALHRRSRPASWKTFEAPRDLSGVLRGVGSKFDVIVIDCLTLFVSNLIVKNRREDFILKEISKCLAMLKRSGADSILISNEVGLSIVPVNALARQLRDIGGRANQLVAKESDSVILMVAGLPNIIKKGVEQTCLK